MTFDNHLAALFVLNLAQVFLFEPLDEHAFIKWRLIECQPIKSLS